MRKLLPIFIFILSTVYCLQSTALVFAQTPTVAPTSAPTPTVADSVAPAGGTVPENTWVKDSEVTFVGKAGARAGAFLDWAITSYRWADGVGGLTSFWVTIRNIVYAFLGLMVLVSAFIFIISRGRNLTVRQLIPRFVMVVLLVTFSFALIQFLYQAVDIIQEFFLKRPQAEGGLISHRDLLFIGFDYKNFIGYRLSGIENDEAAFISLLLIKLTTVTYYLMAGILILRKIILWFFIFMSPIFPFLLLFSPVRNTAKIWVGEFFRWLLYGPIFAILLAGLVALWRSPAGIPLKFTPTSTDTIYPTAINILLGGPGQQISLQNSVNLPETYALYVVSLIMLWVVILLPFLLLKIFLDSFHEFSLNGISMIKQISTNLPFLGKPDTFVSSPPISPTPPPTPPFRFTGMARSLPFENIRSTSAPAINQQSMPILRMTNLSVPTIRDIARIETNTITRDTRTQSEVTHVTQTLEKISNPIMTGSPVERMQYTNMRQSLTSEKQQGNPVASTILQAASMVSAVKSTVPASNAASAPSFPVVNRVQTVSVEDYEAVKKLWHENYQKLDTPTDPSGKPKDRREWVKSDVDTVTQAINLLLSNDPKQIKEGMQMVGTILPFLLIGGFSQTEVIAYLKAKLEAGKTTLSDIDVKQEEEDTKFETKEVKKEEHAAMEAHAELPNDDEKSNQTHNE